MTAKPQIEANRLPQVDKVLRQAILSEANICQPVLAQLVRQELKRLREDKVEVIPTIEEIARSVLTAANKLLEPGLKPVINGTGIILNTNLGRAPWAQAVVNNAVSVVSGYANLETNLESGKRGKRLARIEELLQVLVGCESALVVNNNAAAVLLAINTLAKDKEVIISRGELVEIGGSFRLPDVITSAAGILREVGTTNRTRVSDYKNQVSDNSGLLFKCHRSNFEIVGFTEETSLADLVLLSKETKIPLLDDLGSGILLAKNLPGLKQESVADVVASGADLITFSGDKLLGGPQAGIIVGRANIIDRLHKNPLYRALRPDKLIISALEAQLQLYLTPSAEKQIPALNMMAVPAPEIKVRVEAFIARAAGHLQNLHLQLTKTESTTGGGSLPGLTIDSYGIILQSKASAHRLSNWLRTAATPVIAITVDDQVVLDFRTIFAGAENSLVDVLVYIDKKYL